MLQIHPSLRLEARNSNQQQDSVNCASESPQESSGIDFNILHWSEAVLFRASNRVPVRDLLCTSPHSSMRLFSCSKVGLFLDFLILVAVVVEFRLRLFGSLVFLGVSLVPLLYWVFACWDLVCCLGACCFLTLCYIQSMYYNVYLCSSVQIARMKAPGPLL